MVEWPKSLSDVPKLRDRGIPWNSGLTQALLRLSTSNRGSWKIPSNRLYFVQWISSSHLHTSRIAAWLVFSHVSPSHPMSHCPKFGWIWSTQIQRCTMDHPAGYPSYGNHDFSYRKWPVFYPLNFDRFFSALNSIAKFSGPCWATHSARDVGCQGNWWWRWGLLQ